MQDFTGNIAILLQLKDLQRPILSWGIHTLSSTSPSYPLINLSQHLGNRNVQGRQFTPQFQLQTDSSSKDMHTLQRQSIAMLV